MGYEDDRHIVIWCGALSNLQSSRHCPGLARITAETPDTGRAAIRTGNRETLAHPSDERQAEPSHHLTSRLRLTNLSLSHIQILSLRVTRLSRLSYRLIIYISL